MSCPHGLHSNPDSCSQCLGVRARRVDVVAGVLSVDGTPLGDLTSINKEKSREEGEQGRPRKLKTCGRCRLPGHNSATCPQPAN